MPGTIEGGRKAAETNKKRYGKAFYVRIGAIGGKKSTGGGFAANPELARIAGAKGGRARKKAEAK
ncbi:MAG: KGG domain-containing protein [Candidatus Saccharibacteria bacterium]|jgi:general stress protein YciG